ncbi:MAG: aminotransferase class IV [Psychromonas sp.]
MSIVYLNGDYMPMNEAKISPMDRGFLFGDGIYEVVPSYEGKLVGFKPHLQRMQDGLDAIEIQLQVSYEHWYEIAMQLIKRNEGESLGIYFHVSRGAEDKRSHAYSQGIEPTIYAFAFPIADAPIADKSAVTSYSVSTTEDLRWRRCNIKSTALLGNVMHYQHGHAKGHNETILFNQDLQITEAAACNVFVIKNGVVATPNLDNQILPGITRFMLLDILRRDGSIPIEERIVHLSELHDADEVWITSSSKEVAPVLNIDDKPVADGKVGNVWLAAQSLYSKHKFDY